MPEDSQEILCPICIQKVSAQKAYVNWYCPNCLTVMNEQVLKAQRDGTSAGDTNDHNDGAKS